MKGGIHKYIGYIKRNTFLRQRLTINSTWAHLSVRIYLIRNASAYIHFMSFVWKSDVLQTMCSINTQCSTINIACTIFLVWTYLKLHSRVVNVFIMVHVPSFGNIQCNPVEQAVFIKCFSFFLYLRLICMINKIKCLYRPNINAQTINTNTSLSNPICSTKKKSHNVS